MARTISGPRCAYPRRDGQAEWARVAWSSSNPNTNRAWRTLTPLTWRTLFYYNHHYGIACQCLQLHQHQVPLRAHVDEMGFGASASLRQSTALCHHGLDRRGDSVFDYGRRNDNFSGFFLDFSSSGCQVTPFEVFSAVTGVACQMAVGWWAITWHPWAEAFIRLVLGYSDGVGGLRDCMRMLLQKNGSRALERICGSCCHCI